MLNKLFLWDLLTLLFISMSMVSTAQSEVMDVERPLLMAHYMPWYQTPDVSGYWGWHWTMEHFNPSITDDNGRPEFASHYLPLTGLYDSQDPAILEYQVLLMKLSGLDGVIVDWYGMEHFRDYAELNAATLALFDYTKRAGLNFIICYEDRTIGHMIDEGYIEADQAHAHGTEVASYLQEHWFSDPSYVTFNGQPLLFIFGPQYFRTPQDWDEIFAGLETPPALVTLDGRMSFGVLSSYPWPPMHMSGGIELAPAAQQAYLDLFYRNARRNDLIVGTAWPGFHDIYEEAGERSSYGYIDPRDGDTFRETLQSALDINANIIQIATWNDYGEGTIIEPTEETGYTYLEILQNVRAEVDSDFDASQEALSLPLRLFHLRREYASDATINAQLDAVFDAIVNNQLDEASAILDALD